MEQENQHHKEFIGETCQKIINKVAITEQINPSLLFVRIDLPDLDKKPLLSLYKFKERIRECELRELVKAAGAGVFAGLYAMSVRKIIKDVFSYAKEKFTPNYVSDIFALLYLSGQTPVISLYGKDGLKETMLIADIINGALTIKDKEDDHKADSSEI